MIIHVQIKLGISFKRYMAFGKKPIQEKAALMGHLQYKP